MLKRLARYALVCAAITGLAGCNLPQWALNDLFGPPPAVQFPGRFDAFGDNVYPGLTNPLEYAVSGAEAVGGLMQSVGAWSENRFASDCGVTANSFSSDNGDIDALYFQGHGAPGIVELCEAFVGGQPATSQAWGPCTTSGSIVAGNGATYPCPPHSTAGFPISGRLKWIFLNSSDSVAAPPGEDPGDSDWTADWSGAFGAGLHGIYGGWQAPGFSCTGGDPPNRSCDLLDGNNVGKDFALLALPAQPGSGDLGEDVHDAWLNAMQTADQDDGWGIWEDDAARDDDISGPSSNGVNPPTYTPVLSGVLDFDFASPVSPPSFRPMTVQPSVFTLAPRSLINEAINHNALAEQNSASLGSAAIKDDGSLYRIHGPGWELEHWYGTSGALIYAASSPQTTMAIPESSALVAATQFVQGTFGVPSDATLSSILQQWDYQPQNSSLALTGYEFIWTHNDGLYGGDAIKVMVTDWRTSNETCTQWGFSDPPVRRICIAWKTTYSDSPYVSYAYRLWRSLGTTTGAQPAGRASISALAAASALPAGAVVTDYRSGLWTPMVDQSSSIGARSAWIFTLNGRSEVGVDAATGKILGSVSP